MWVSILLLLCSPFTKTSSNTSNSTTCTNNSYRRREEGVGFGGRAWAALHVKPSDSELDLHIKAARKGQMAELRRHADEHRQEHFQMGQARLAEGSLNNVIAIIVPRNGRQCAVAAGCEGCGDGGAGGEADKGAGAGGVRWRLRKRRSGGF